MSDSPVAPGYRLGRYTLLSLLGAGGMGEVYLAEDPILERKVAIKVLLGASATTEEAQQRMLREARTAARLEHPNICGVYEAGVDHDRPYVVMQYLEGRTVAELLRDSGRLPIETILDIASAVAAGLKEAHDRGIVHRDIKPQNVMVSERGVRILDFGLARGAENPESAATDDRITRTGVVSGTTAYMSPEQLRMEGFDWRSDIFSFGVMLCEMLSGHRPFDRRTAADTIAAILNDVPPPLPSRGKRADRLDLLIRLMLQKDASLRPPCAGVLDELNAVRSMASSGDVETTMLDSSALSGARSAPATPSPGSGSRSSSIVLGDPELQKLYLKGQHLLEKRSVPNLRQALETFQSAVDLDPGCAHAYVGLAECYLLLGFIQALPPRATFPRAKAACLRAIEIEPSLAGAHAVLGYVHYVFDWDTADAVRELGLAIEADQGLASAHHWLGLVLSACCRFDEGASELRTACVLAPLSPIYATALGFHDYYGGRFDEAAGAYREVLELEPSFIPAYFYLGLALEQRGSSEEALAAFEKANAASPVLTEAFPAAAHLLARAGRRAEAQERLAILSTESSNRIVPPMYFAVVHLGLGDYDAAFESLAKSFAGRGVRLSDLHLDHRFAVLRDDQRFRELIRQIGVAPK